MVTSEKQMGYLTQAEMLREQDVEVEPVHVLEIEISTPLPDLPPAFSEPGKLYHQGLFLVRLHSLPVGTIELPLGERTWMAAELSARIWQALGNEINQHLVLDGLPPVTGLPAAGIPAPQKPGCMQVRERLLANPPFISVVIATRNRTESLAVTLESLGDIQYSNFEIIVVDNAPSTEDTADYIRSTYGNSDQVRYVREDRPGLAVAHNRGLREVKGEIVAFTDDDVLVDWHWLAELALGFRAGDNVACVTGMIFPAILETPAQVWAEQMVRFNKGLQRQVYDLQNHRPNLPLFPFAAGIFGSGANMAFKTSALRSIGGFDPVTGTGTPALGGDDLTSFFDIVHAGYQLVYQPTAIVYHNHRRDYPGLKRQTYGYGAGLTAYLTRILVRHPEVIPGFITRIPAGIAYALSPHSLKNRSKRAGYPSELNGLERKGMIYGPLAYLRSRWNARKYAGVDGDQARQPSLAPEQASPKPEANR